jgi:hypothetical protein
MMSKEAGKKIVLWLVLVTVLLGGPVIKNAVAAPPAGWGNYTLAFYTPPTFGIDVWLGEQNSATIFYDGTKFQVDTAFQSKMHGKTLEVLADALDYAIETEKAMTRTAVDEVAQ